MTQEITMGARRSGRTGQDADPYDGIESALAELAQSPPDSTEARALRDQLVRRCLPLAEHVARRYTGRGEDYDDLFQAASGGVAMAIDRFDRAQGKPFLAFAAPAVLGEVRKRFLDRTWALKVLRRGRETQAMIGPTVESMTDRLGRVPTAMEIAVRLDAELLEVTRALLSAHWQAGTAQVTLTRGTDAPGYELIMQQRVAPRLLAELSDAQRWVLYLRLFRNRSRAQIATQLGVPLAQVGWMLSRALDAIREPAPRS